MVCCYKKIFKKIKLIIEPDWKVLFAFLIACAYMQAKVMIILPSIIGSHMVLQQHSTITIWGWCAPQEEV